MNTNVKQRIRSLFFFLFCCERKRKNFCVKNYCRLLGRKDQKKKNLHISNPKLLGEKKILSTFQLVYRFDSYTSVFSIRKNNTLKADDDTHTWVKGSTPRKSGPPTAGGSRTRNTGDGTPPSDSASCSSPPRTSSTSRGSWKSDRYIHTTGFPAKAGRRKGRSRRNEGQEDDGGEKERREKENDDACVASRKEGQINLAFEERERERERGSERENSRSVYKGVADLI